MRVIIAGGGTGGHLFPALAVGEELVRERPDTEVLYAGTSAGFEAKWLPKSGYRYELFQVHGIRGHGPAARARAALEFVRAIGLAQALLKRFRPALVVSAGGYASAPVGVAAIFARVPIVLMEQNTRPGLANKILWRFARRICVGFDDVAPYFDRARVEVTGNPVRYRPRPAEPRGEGAPFQILVLGGSTGAHRMNLGVVGAFKIWGKSVINLHVTHQCGEADTELLRQEYRQLPFEAEVASFVDDVPAALSRADLVVARGGAMTVTDIALAGRPAIFVPYPFHRDRQQAHNARVIERVGGAIIVADDDRLAQNLAEHMKSMLGDPELLAEMGRRALAVMPADGAARIARICFKEARVEN